ncbi:ATP-dependent DNA ligase [Candidatus Woesearchaeota archaeon]|nr:ATP-dependent DNA ligase [Candidatus Woesearchaeota archaeon]
MKFLNLAELFNKLESTSKRLEKTHYISEFIKTVEDSDLDMVMLLLQARIFPDWDDTKVGVAARMLLKAINIATGIDFKDVEEEWKSTGDLGLAAENLIARKKQATLFSQDLSISKVFSNLTKLAKLEGSGTVDKKVKLISELLTSAKPLEARYIVRTLIEELRIGAGEGSLRDSIVWAYLMPYIVYDPESNTLALDDEQRKQYNDYTSIAQEALDITNDFAIVAKTARHDRLDGLKRVNLEPGHPIKVMLCNKAKDIEDSFKKCGDKVAIENKLDGFRMQIHKFNGAVKIFTRRLEDVTKQFPEVVDYVNQFITGESFIIDSEAIGFDPLTNRYLPFQNISQRIRRKYDVHELAKKLPVELNIFDILYYGDVNMLKMPLLERRAFIEKVVKQEQWKIKLVKNIVTDDKQAALDFYKESLADGFEGVIVKNIDAPYRPGKRVEGWVKIKPVMQELDLVIVGADFGHGKRSDWFSSFTLACRDEDTGEFMEIGKLGTGFKEKEDTEGLTFSQLTEMLKPLIIAESSTSVRLKPEIVIEVHYEEIQKSPTYGSGFALRFPRLSRLREDRRATEISTLQFINSLYEEQR